MNDHYLQLARMQQDLMLQQQRSYAQQKWAQYTGNALGNSLLRPDLTLVQTSAISTGYNSLLNTRYEPPKPFPRTDYQRNSIWRRRLMQIETKKWDRRKMILSEWAWKVGIVWAGLGVVALTIVLASLLMRLIVG